MVSPKNVGFGLMSEEAKALLRANASLTLLLSMTIFP
jgi:hypothetical protein